MKKIITTLALTSTLLLGTIFTGCQSSAQKETAARNNVLEAKQDLKDAQNDANIASQKVADSKEWETFKNDAFITIMNN